MPAAAEAFAWEFRRKHRWGVLALLAYAAALAAMRIFGAQRIAFADEVTFAFVVVVPMTACFFYFLAVFTFGLAGDIAARQSIYPPRLFTLPLTTNALAGWPMLYGAIAMAALWIVTRSLAVWPAAVPVPIIWPALLGPALLAWTQAFTWMPYPLPGLRVVVTVLWLTIIDAVVMIALELKAPEAVMIAILAPQVPLAYLVARAAVARARRGDVPDWRIASRGAARAGRPFASAADAQSWLEWRLHGRSLPAMVAIVLPFELAMLFLFRETEAIVIETLGMVLFSPPFLAMFVAATFSESSLFTATRPLANAELVGAKLKVALRSTLAAWLLVAIGVAIALPPVAIERARWLAGLLGTPRAIVLGLLVLAMLVAATWKQLVQSLYIGMSGRGWMVKASVFVPLAVLVIAGVALHWVTIPALWNAAPWILAALVVLKIFAAAWVAARLPGLLHDRTLILGAAAWSATVFALYAVLRWIFPEILVHGWFIALVAILAVPLARLGAAPLALEGSRHR